MVWLHVVFHRILLISAQGTSHRCKASYLSVKEKKENDECQSEALKYVIYFLYLCVLNKEVYEYINNCENKW